MSVQFDPYYRWLAIPPSEQPPNYYRLLGTQLFESDREVIRDAAERQMAHVRTYQLGRFADVSQTLLNELGAARACLLDAARKAEYDRKLGKDLAAARALAPTAPAPPPPPEPPPVAARPQPAPAQAAPAARPGPPAPPPLPSRPGLRARQWKVKDTCESVLLGPCELRSALFQGSSATIFRARNAERRAVAVKALAGEFAVHPGCLARFYEQAAVLMRLSHPNLIEVFEVGEDRGGHFWIAEHLEAESLRRIVERDGAMDPLQAVRLVRSAAEAAAALHRAGLVHRCILPANILMTRSGRAKLTEWGLEGYVDEHIEPIHSGLGLETQQYLAPEQIRRESAADARSDVYSLGATLYTLVTARIPFRGPSLSDLLAVKDVGAYRPAESINRDISPSLAEVIARCLEPDPANRPPSLEQFIQLLDDDLERVGRYKLLEETGRGQAGTVFRARGPDGCDVAVKFLSDDAARNERRLARFQREAELLKQISHPHLVQAIEAGQYQGRPYIVMEYVGGGNLASYVTKAGHLGEPEALKIAIDLAQALDGVHHHGVVHRDVNPANVLLTPHRRAKLGDLGLSKQVDDQIGLTMDGTGLGTPEYIAPEQFTGAKDVDRRSDVYGLGVSLYVMLTGKLPFVGKTNIDKLMAKAQNEYRSPEQFNPAITPMTVELVKRSIDADPDKRPASAGEFAMAAMDCLNPARNRYATADALEGRAEQDVFWHVILAEHRTIPHRLKATEAQMKVLVAGDRIGRGARASLGGGGPYVPLETIPELAALLPEVPVLLPARAPAGPFGRLWASLRRLFGG